MTSASEFYKLSSIDTAGREFSFEGFKGKVVIVVNSASTCGFAYQYEQLEKLYQKYEGKLAIISFPCNQFGYQEPFKGKELLEFHQSQYHVTFPIMNRIACNGPDTDPVYKYLKPLKTGYLGFQGVSWNYEKFLVSKEGEVVARYLSTIAPDDFADVISKLISEGSEDSEEATAQT